MPTDRRLLLLVLLLLVPVAVACGERGATTRVASAPPPGTADPGPVDLPVVDPPAPPATAPPNEPPPSAPSAPTATTTTTGAATAPPAPGPAPDVWGRTVRATAATRSGAPVPAVAGTEYVLDFGQDGMRLTAGGGCRTTSTDARFEGDVLTLVRPVDSTGEACAKATDAQEATLVALLTGRPTVALDGDAVIVRSASVEIRFVGPLRRPRPVGDPVDARLRGRRFTATASATGGSPQPTAAGSAYSLRFDDDGGGARWSGGCNDAFAKLVVTGGRIELVDGAGTTAMACAAERMSQDGLLGKLLAGHPTVVVDGTDVVLRSDETEIRFAAA